MASRFQLNLNTPTQGREIEIDGIGRVQVSDEFFSLSPEQQNQAVLEIATAYRGQQEARGVGQVPTGSALGPQAAATAQVLAGAAQGAGHVLDNAAELAQGAYNNTLGHVFGYDYSATEANNRPGGIEGLVNPDGRAQGGFEGLANRIGPGDPTGRFVGEMGASALLTRGMGPVTAGAATGAVLSEADNPLDFGIDVATGGVGGAIGDRLVRGAQAVIAPRVSEAARRLRDRGVHITPGQASEPLRRWEERRMSRPFLGDNIIEGRQQGYRDFNRVALEDVVAPVNALGGRPIAVPQEMGNEAIRRVGDQVSGRYNNLVPRLTLRPDAQLTTDIQAVAANLGNGDLTPAAVQQFNEIVTRQVTPFLGRGALSGQAYRQIERRLGRQIARFGRSQDPDHQAMAGAFREMQEAFQGGLQRSNPRHAQELAALNESWANLVRVEGAAEGAVGGLFSPRQFRQSVRRADNSTRRRAVARGEARMQQLADDAADVLPSQYPDSGTSGRQQDNPLDPRFWLGALQGRAYTPQVQGALTDFLMAPRPGFAQPVTNFLDLLPAPQAGAAAALSGVNSLRGF